MEDLSSTTLPSHLTLQELLNSGALNRLLGKLFDGGNIGLLLIAPDHSIIDADDTSCHMLGYEKEVLLGMTTNELTHPDDLNKSLDFISNRKNKGGDLFHIEKRYLTKTGDTFWTRVRVEEFSDDQGKLLFDLAMLEDITEIKKREESLTLARQQLQSITDNIPALIAYIDKDLCYQFINANYENLFKISKAEIIGKKISDMLPPSSWKIARPKIHKALSGKPVTFEDHFNQSPDNMGHHTLIKMVPDINSQGETIGIFIHITDISEEKAQEALLKKAHTNLIKSEENMQRMMDASPDTVLVVSHDGIIFFANPKIEEMFGYEVHEVIGASVEELLPSALREAHRAHREIYNTAPYIRRMNLDKHLVGQKQDGQLLPVDIGLSPMQYNGQDAILVTIRDVAEIRSTMETNEQLAAIVEASSDAIFKTNTESKILFWSKGAQKLYGYTAEEMIGKYAHMLIPKQEESARLSILQSLIKGKYVDQHNAKRLHKDGHLIEVSISIFPIKNTSGEVIGLAAIHRDIQEMRHMEEQLRHAQKMETAGQLAGGIAHDFNNILTVIQGYCSLISQDLPEGSKMLSYLNLIESSSQRASALTRQLLTFSRKQRIDPKLFDPKTLITELLIGLQRSMGEHISLQTNLQSHWMIKEDPAQFEQIVLNLLVNARQAMPKGGMLSITTSDVTIDDSDSKAAWGNLTFTPQQVSPGSYLLLSIADTGFGMSKEVAERIFEPFYTTKPRGEGTGLGLSVVYGLVTQAGGAIHVESIEKQGTCFHVFLPKAQGEIETPKIPQSIMPEGIEKILLVEDDEDVRHLTTAILKSAGYDVIAASAPKEVFDTNIQGKFDLILSDIVMPGMSGPEFAEIWLKEHPEDHFLFMSGYADDSILPFASSTENLVQKPFKPAELLERVRDAIDNSKA